MPYSLLWSIRCSRTEPPTFQNPPRQQHSSQGTFTNILWNTPTALQKAPSAFCCPLLRKSSLSGCSRRLHESSPSRSLQDLARANVFDADRLKLRTPMPPLAPPYAPAREPHVQYNFIVSIIFCRRNRPVNGAFGRSDRCCAGTRPRWGLTARASSSDANPPAGHKASRAGIWAAAAWPCVSMFPSSACVNLFMAK